LVGYKRLATKSIINLRERKKCQLEEISENDESGKGKEADNTLEESRIRKKKL
jgi:hypothetical protein